MQGSSDQFRFLHRFHIRRFFLLAGLAAVAALFNSIRFSDDRVEVDLSSRTQNSHGMTASNRKSERGEAEQRFQRAAFGDCFARIPAEPRSAQNWKYPPTRGIEADRLRLQQRMACERLRH